MRLFLDTEFTGLTHDADLISLALVAADGTYFYAEFTDYDQAKLTNWHQDNVIAHLFLSDKNKAAPPNGTTCHGTKKDIVSELRSWLNQWDKVEIWADVPAYDWVFFCALFGGALQLPSNIHYIVRDLATLLLIRSYDPDTDRFALAFDQQEPPASLARHNALADAWGGMEILKKIEHL